MLKAIPTAVICIGLTTLLTACNEKTGSTNAVIKLDTDKNKASYSIGVQLGSQIAKIKDMVNEDAILSGFNDSLSGKETQLTTEEMKTAMETFQQTMMEAQKTKQLTQAESGKAEGD